MKSRLREASITTLAMLLAIVSSPKPFAASFNNFFLNYPTFQNAPQTQTQALIASTTPKNSLQISSTDPDLRIYDSLPWWLWWFSLPVLGGWLWWLLHNRQMKPVFEAIGEQANSVSRLVSPPSTTELLDELPDELPEKTSQRNDFAIHSKPSIQDCQMLSSSIADSATHAPSTNDLATLTVSQSAHQTYEQSRIVLVPCNAKHAYAYWEIAEADRVVAKQQGGIHLILRVYEVTEMNLDFMPAHSIQQFQCEEWDQDRHLSIPLSERDYVAEIGYITLDGRWIPIVRSLHVRVSELQPIGFGNG
jgi:hypothetical protein